MLAVGFGPGIGEVAVVKRLVVLWSVALLMLTLAPVVYAGDQYSGCTENQWNQDSTRWILYEQNVGNFVDGYDLLYGCGNKPDLSQVLHAPAGTCDRNNIFPDFNHWGDCANAAYVKIPSGYVWCIFMLANYRTNSSVDYQYKVGPYEGTFNLTGNLPNEGSSVGMRLGVSGNNCLDWSNPMPVRR